MIETPPPALQDDTPEDYQFLPRLMFSYLLAAVAFVAVEKSLYIELVTVVVWTGLTVHLFRRFGRRALWTLIGAPAAFYWAWLLWRGVEAARQAPTIV